MDWWVAQAQGYEDQFNKKQAEEISGDVVQSWQAVLSSMPAGWFETTVKSCVEAFDERKTYQSALELLETLSEAAHSCESLEPTYLSNVVWSYAACSYASGMTGERKVSEAVLTGKKYRRIVYSCIRGQAYREWDD